MSVGVEGVVAQSEDPIAAAIRGEYAVSHAADLPQADIDLLMQAQAEQTWVSAAALASVAAARVVGRTQGETLLEARRRNLRDGEYDQVPEAVDPLSEARRVHEAEKLYGKNSPEHRRTQAAFDVSCERLTAEAWRVFTWEYFPELEQQYDEPRDEYMFGDRSLSDMVDDGVTPLADPEEGENRLIEKVEETTYVALRKVGAVALQSALAGVAQKRPEMNVVTVSECNDSAIEAYKEDVAAGRKPAVSYGGHVPKIEKFMIRGVRYGAHTTSRYQEQLALSGEHITHDVIVQAIRVVRAIGAGQHLTKAEVRATQMINMNGEGVLSFAALLDHLASQATGKRIFLGEIIPEDQPKDYANIPFIAEERQQKQKDASREISAYIAQLEQRGTDPVVAGKLIDLFVRKVLYKSVKHNPAEALQVYDDEETLDKIKDYNAALAVGDQAKADLIDQDIQANLPPAVFCGAGSCDLEGVDPTSIDGAAALRLGLKAKNSDQLLHFKKGVCVGCKKKGIYFDTAGNKACTGCGEAEINGKRKVGKAKEDKKADTKAFALAA